ncbi:OsmC family protein [Maridesulfovibrio sp.]|uniref:OsmC family protein n=1 Tax=Maridesulfovibrio sp. TaxID=2795000 RepID=UPI002A18E642|nr:OsmC family protein [Maridesulfovibrio sp.]
MSKEMIIEFGPGKTVSAASDGFTIVTDLPDSLGGDGSAPTPMNLFMASLATCAAHFARNFCESRSISMDGMGMKVEYTADPETKQLTKFNYQLTLPEGFPEKYKAALLRAVDMCPIKKQLLTPPSFNLEIV